MVTVRNTLLASVVLTVAFRSPRPSGVVMRPLTVANDAAGALLWNSENGYLVKPYLRGLKEHASTSDNEWLGQFGPVVTFDVDLANVGTNYPNQ